MNPQKTSKCCFSDCPLFSFEDTLSLETFWNIFSLDKEEREFFYKQFNPYLSLDKYFYSIYEKPKFKSLPQTVPFKMCLMHFSCYQFLDPKYSQNRPVITPLKSLNIFLKTKYSSDFFLQNHFLTHISSSLNHQTSKGHLDQPTLDELHRGILLLSCRSSTSPQSKPFIASFMIETCTLLSAMPPLSDSFKHTVYSICCLVLVYIRPLLTDPVFRVSASEFVPRVRTMVLAINLKSKIEKVFRICEQTNYFESNLISLVNLITNTFSVHKLVSKDSVAEPLKRLCTFLLNLVSKKEAPIKGMNND